MKKKQPAKNQRSIFFFIPLLKNLNLAPPPPPSRSHFFRNKSDDTCDTIAFSTVFSTIILSYVIIMHRLLIFYAFYSLSSLKKFLDICDMPMCYNINVVNVFVTNYLISSLYMSCLLCFFYKRSNKMHI